MRSSKYSLSHIRLFMDRGGGKPNETPYVFSTLLNSIPRSNERISYFHFPQEHFFVITFPDHSFPDVYNSRRNVSRMKRVGAKLSPPPCFFTKLDFKIFLLTFQNLAENHFYAIITTQQDNI